MSEYGTTAFWRNLAYESERKADFTKSREYYQKAVEAYPTEALIGELGKRDLESLKRKAKGDW